MEPGAESGFLLCITSCPCLWEDVGCSTSWEKKVPGREVIAILFLFQGSKQLMEQWGGCDSSHIASGWTQQAFFK